MNSSPQIANLAASLVKAQAGIGIALKDKNNPFFKSKYADLSSVVDAIKGPISENGLAYTQVLHDADNCAKVETIIIHSSGEWMSSGIIAVPVSKNDAQGYGSAITYARRYSLSAAFGVVADDDDGNAAAAAAPKSGATVARDMTSAKIIPNADAEKNVTAEEKKRVDKVASEIIDCFEAGQPDTALEVYEEAAMSNEEKLYLWTLLTSTMKSTLKRLGKAKQLDKSLRESVPIQA